MRSGFGALLAIAVSGCATSSLSTLELVAYDEVRRPMAIPMQVLERNVEERRCAFDFGDRPGPTFGEVIGAAIRSVDGANAFIDVRVVQQIRHLWPWFFDRYCLTVSGDAVRVGVQ